MAAQGVRTEETTKAAGLSARTAYKSVRRFREEGAAGLTYRRSRPPACLHATPIVKGSRALERRRARQTYRTIVQDFGAVAEHRRRLLGRARLKWLAALEPVESISRREHEEPVYLPYLDIKALGRFRRPRHRLTGDRRSASNGAGLAYVHVAIDDHSHVAFNMSLALNGLLSLHS